MAHKMYEWISKKFYDKEMFYVIQLRSSKPVNALHCNIFLCYFWTMSVVKHYDKVNIFHLFEHHLPQSSIHQAQMLFTQQPVQCVKSLFTIEYKYSSFIHWRAAKKPFIPIQYKLGRPTAQCIINRAQVCVWMCFLYFYPCED